MALEDCWYSSISIEDLPAVNLFQPLDAEMIKVILQHYGSYRTELEGQLVVSIV